MEQNLNWEKELKTQKLITAYEKLNDPYSTIPPYNQLDDRITPLQVPTYACYLYHAKYCSAGQNSIDRYLDATGFDADVIEKATVVELVYGSGCGYGVRNFMFVSNKMAILPIQIPNCKEFLHVPIRVIEGGYRDMPLRMGQEFDTCLQ